MATRENPVPHGGSRYDGIDRLPSGLLHEVGDFSGDIEGIPELTKDQAGLVQIDGKLFVMTKTGARKPFLISLLKQRIV